MNAARRSGWPHPLDGAGETHQPGARLAVDCSIGEVEARLDEVDRDEGMMLFAVDGKSGEFAILECGCSRHARRAQQGSWLVGTNHARELDEPPPKGSSRLRFARMETLATELYDRDAPAQLPRDLIAILSDDGVERRGPPDVYTVFSNVACPGTGQLWFTFGAYPAASHGAWERVSWPW